jgi:hypothetical protein
MKRTPFDPGDDYRCMITIGSGVVKKYPHAGEKPARPSPEAQSDLLHCQKTGRGGHSFKLVIAERDA